MKRSIVVLLSILSLLIMTGCGPSLREYVAKSNTYSSKISSKASVQVNIESRPVVESRKGKAALVGAAVNIATSVGAAAVGNEQKKRINRIVTTNEIMTLVAAGFDDGFADMTHLTIVEPTANPDLRVMMTVREYGLWAKSLLSPMNFYVEAEIKVVDTASMETVYTNGATIMREASSVFTQMAGTVSDGARFLSHFTGSTTAVIVGSSANLVSGAANLTAFFKLSDQEVKAIFDYLAYDAGSVIAGDLTSAIYD